MNWDQIEGQWKQLKGEVKSKWSKLTDDDVEFMKGSHEQFMGKLQERYGMAKDAAKRELEEWIDGMKPKTPTTKGSGT